jgi:hypothetical protein
MSRFRRTRISEGAKCLFMTARKVIPAVLPMCRKMTVGRASTVAATSGSRRVTRASGIRELVLLEVERITGRARRVSSEIRSRWYGRAQTRASLVVDAEARSDRWRPKG